MGFYTESGAPVIDRPLGAFVPVDAQARASRMLDRGTATPARNQAVRRLLGDILAGMTPTTLDDIADSLSSSLRFGDPIRYAQIGKIVADYVLEQIGVAS